MELTNIERALLSIKAEIHHGAQRSRQTTAKIADRLPLHALAVHSLEDITDVQTSCSAEDQCEKGRIKEREGVWSKGTARVALTSSSCGRILVHIPYNHF